MDRRELFKMLAAGFSTPFMVWIAASWPPQEPVWPQWVNTISDIEGEIPAGNAVFVSDGHQLWRLDDQGWTRL